MVRILDVINNFKDKKILVLGDIILDEYIFGEATRISPEAPIPVIKLQRRDYRLGGASNVANNIVSLGAEAFLCGVIGNDSNGQKLKVKLLQEGINTEGLVIDTLRPTTTKTRVMAQHLHHNYQQFVRVDEEEQNKISQDIEENIIFNLEKIIPKVNLIIISDYDKGILTEKIIRKIEDLSRLNNKPTIVNPKPKNIALFENFDYIISNRTETEKLTNLSLRNLDENILKEVGNIILDKFNITGFLMTCDKHGVVVYNKNGFQQIPTKAKELGDVTGAGDTMIAALSLSLSSGASLVDAAKIANYAAGIVIGKMGTSVVNSEELINVIKNEL